MSSMSMSSRTAQSPVTMAMNAASERYTPSSLLSSPSPPSVVSVALASDSIANKVVITACVVVQVVVVVVASVEAAIKISFQIALMSNLQNILTCCCFWRWDSSPHVYQN